MPVYWNFDGNILVVKLIAEYTTEQLFQAFTEALASNAWPDDARALCDVRYAVNAILPEVINDRVQFVFDALQGKVSRYAMLTAPDSMLRIADLVVRQLTALGMETRHFTNLADALRWLRSDDVKLARSSSNTACP